MGPGRTVVVIDDDPGILNLIERSGRPAPLEAGGAPAPPVPEPSTGRRRVSFDDVPPGFRRVLIVGDDRDYRQWLRQLLEPHGFAVLECDAAARALSLAERAGARRLPPARRGAPLISARAAARAACGPGARSWRGCRG